MTVAFRFLLVLLAEFCVVAALEHTAGVDRGRTVGGAVASICGVKLTTASVVIATAAVAAASNASSIKGGSPDSKTTSLMGIKTLLFSMFLCYKTCIKNNKIRLFTYSNSGRGLHCCISA